MGSIEEFRARIKENGCKDVVSLCADLGIILPTSSERDPEHCGQEMQVKGGILGPDYVRCKVCGLTIGNVLSPHINGGRVFFDEAYEEKETWCVLEKPPAEGGGE